MGLFERIQQLSGIRPKKSSSPPPRSKGLFDEKKEWSRIELRRKMLKASPYIPGSGGKIYSRRERREMIDKMFPYQRFKSHISETEVKKCLRKLRKEEYRAKTSTEKLKLSRQRRYLEEQLGLKGKY